MRVMTSEFVAAILAVSIPAVAMAQGPLEVPMVAIEGGSFPMYEADNRPRSSVAIPTLSSSLDA